MTQNPIEKFKRLIVMAAFAAAITWTLAGSDFMGPNTRLIISGVCGAGLVVFLLFYKEEVKPEPTKYPLRQAPAPARSQSVGQPGLPPEAHDPKDIDGIDVSKVITQARAHVKDVHNEIHNEKEEDIFGGFE